MLEGRNDIRGDYFERNPDITEAWSENINH